MGLTYMFRSLARVSGRVPGIVKAKSPNIFRQRSSSFAHSIDDAGARPRRCGGYFMTSSYFSGYFRRKSTSDGYSVSSNSYGRVSWRYKKYRSWNVRRLGHRNMLTESAAEARRAMRAAKKIVIILFQSRNEEVQR